MSLSLLVAGALALLWLALGYRLWRRRAPAWLLRCLLQALAFACLYRVLVPGDEVASGSRLVVLTPGLSAAQQAAVAPGTDTVALPGVTAPGVTLVPDLATALRERPAARQILVVGAGLPERDREVLAGRSLVFQPASMPDGLIRVSAAAIASAGDRWTVTGRAQAASGAQVELKDPGGQTLARAIPDAHGEFRLQATLKGEGRALYSLRLVDAKTRVLDETQVAVDVRPGSPLTILIRAGGPDPETKYLRRWMSDAGFTLASRLNLSEGLAMDQGRPGLDAASLDKADWLILDERAWAGLGAGEKTAIRAAVAGGLGLLLRITGALPPTVASDWQGFGLRVNEDDQVSRNLRFGQDTQARTLSRQGVSVYWPGSVPLVTDSDGEEAGRWHVQGLGRVGVIWLNDSFRLVLSGDGGRYGALWSGIGRTLARARGDTEPVLPARALAGERSVLCGLRAGARLLAGDGSETPLLVENGCAGFWPATAGWQILETGGARWNLYVHAPDENRSLRFWQRRRATEALASGPAPAWEQVQGAGFGQVPAFLLWLALTTGLWFGERRWRQSPAQGLP